jgi:hypothetical protein
MDPTDTPRNVCLPGIAAFRPHHPQRGVLDVQESADAFLLPHADALPQRHLHSSLHNLLPIILSREQGRGQEGKCHGQADHVKK